MRLTFTRNTTDRVTFLVGLAAGTLVGFRTISYVLYLSGTERHHVESAAFVFAAALLVRAMSLRGGHSDSSRHSGARAASSSVLPVLHSPFPWIAAALVLYWPTLGLGLLSDDYVLAARASDFALVGDEFFRPLPLALWAAIQTVLGSPGASAAAFHALNVSLHGANAFLTLRALGALGVSQRTALPAAALFLLFPLNVEAVAWAAAIFDLLLTTLVLAAVLAVQTRIEFRWRFGAVVLLTLAAIGTKETAIAMPVLLAIALAAAGRHDRRDLLVIAASGAIVLGYALLRLAGDPDAGAVFPPLTGYRAKELLSRPFAALAMPVHAQAAGEHPFLTLAVTLPIPVLLMLSSRVWPADRAAMHGTLLSSAWVLASTAPLFTILFVDQNLQNSRYLYLGSIGWTVLIAQSLNACAAAWSARGAVALMVGVCIAFVGLQRAHLGPWYRAASARDAVLRAARERAPRCPELAIVHAPDHVDGAFVFRNGLAEALAREGISLKPADSVPARCVLDWATATATD